jgi:2-oxoisovalerate dehydrogenase E2 component (dihydrolipoyl transacylase)
MKIFHLPDLGEGLAEAEIREWYIKEGEEVKIDQPLLSVETAKAVVEVPSPYAGKVTRLYGQVHDIIKTHAPLVEFDGLIEANDKASIVGALEERQESLQENVIIGSPSASSDHIKISPTVKALAKLLNVNLNQVTPTGIKGEITAADIKKHAQQSSSAHLSDQAETLHGVRRAMAATMTKAHHEIAQITLMDDVDISHLGTDSDFTVLILQAIVAGIKKEPALNAWFDDKTLKRELLNEIHIGLAIDMSDGLFVPVIHNVEAQNAKDLRDAINHYKDKINSRTITAKEMQGATILLSNFGTIAGKYASPMVVPPTVAILGCGHIYEGVVVSQGQPVVSRILPLSLSVDHRVVTGGEAARFLAAIKEFLANT